MENVRGEDAHYWRYVVAEQVESVPTQWADCHRQLIAGDRWIIDGMKLGVLGERLASADTVIYLDVSTLARLSGVLRRKSASAVGCALNSECMTAGQHLVR